MATIRTLFFPNSKFARVNLLLQHVLKKMTEISSWWMTSSSERVKRRRRRTDKLVSGTNADSKSRLQRFFEHHLNSTLRSETKEHTIL